MAERIASGASDCRFYLVPVAALPTGAVEQTLRLLLDRGWYAFGDRTKGLKHIRAGDQLAFYQSGVGVVADSTTSGPAENRVLAFVPDPKRFRWAVPVERVRYFFNNPIPINPALRLRLDAFHGREPNKSWAWFVQGVRVVCREDFELLTLGLPL